jgi:diguanylate cyclase (GGDEF)-like protein
MTNRPNPPLAPEPGVETIRHEMEALEGRDFQLWSIGLLLLVVVAAGFLSLILPNLMWDLGEMRLDGRYVPQLFFGFIVLVALFNIYALQQRRSLRATRAELLRQLVRSETAEHLALIDPLTEVFNRRYLEKILPKEIKRADRHSESLTMLMIDVDGFKAVNTRFGHVVGDRVLKEVAQILKNTFRTSDTIIRYGGDEFLVLLPEADEEHAQIAVRRLQERVDRWNQANPIPGYRMSLSCGTSAYAKGGRAEEVLASADQRMYEQKERAHQVDVQRTLS